MSFCLPYAESETCNLFQGKWIQDPAGSPLYTNYSCKTIPFKRNCFLNGRNDTDFLNWKWKPDDCELRRFDPRRFLNAVKGKTMAFIGDSLAQNQMESLLCLLSTVRSNNFIFEYNMNIFPYIIISVLVQTHYSISLDALQY